MLITCPNCQASFEFPQDKMRPQGRKVACGACSHQWKIYPQDENIAQQAVAEQPQSLGEPKASTLQSLQHQLMNMQAAEGVSLANALPDGAAVKTVIPPPPTNGAPANQTFANQAPAAPNQASPNQAPANQASSNQAPPSEQPPIEGNSQVDSDDIFGVADDAPPPANMDFDLPDQHGNTGESNNIDATANFDVPSSDFDDPAGFDQPNPQQAEANQTAEPDFANSTLFSGPSLESDEEFDLVLGLDDGDDKASNIPRIPKKPVAAWGMLGVIIMTLMMVLYFEREDFIQTYPPLNGFYGLFGLDKQEFGYHVVINDPATSLILNPDQPRRMVVRGSLFNQSDMVTEVPALTGIFYNSRQENIHQWYFRPDKTVLLPGEEVEYYTEVSNPPRGLVDIRITLATENEMTRAAD